MIWFDGKKIYRKVINCGVLPNKIMKKIPINITNIDEIINFIAMASSKSQKLTLSLPFVNVDGSMVTCYKQNDEIILNTNVDVSYYDTCFVILEYTKNE